jgi:transcriptional regulator with XRE-family HTH domain
MYARRALAAGVKRLRSERGLSQTALAERSGLSVGFIASIEQARKEASMATLDRLSRALDIPVNQLFVPDSRSPRGGYIADIAELLAPMSDAQRTHVLAVVREFSAALTPKKGRGK